MQNVKLRSKFEELIQEKSMLKAAALEEEREKSGKTAEELNNLQQENRKSKVNIINPKTRCFDLQQRDAGSLVEPKFGQLVFESMLEKKREMSEHTAEGLQQEIRELKVTGSKLTVGQNENEGHQVV